jgi:hypothetical protein
LTGGPTSHDLWHYHKGHDEQNRQYNFGSCKHANPNEGVNQCLTDRLAGKDSVKKTVSVLAVTGGVLHFEIRHRLLSPAVLLSLLHSGLWLMGYKARERTKVGLTK